MNRVKVVNLLDRAIQVQFEPDTLVRFEDCWLRDSCRCSLCYHGELNQRVHHIRDVPDSRIVDIKVDEIQIFITWDDNHKSIYTADFLAKYHYGKWYERRRHKPILWRGIEVQYQVKRIHVDKFLNSVEGSKYVFQSIIDYGFAFIQGVKPTLAATQTVVEALGGVQETIFGGMWRLAVKKKPQDLAFTNFPLRAHTDSSFFAENAGLQTFHCLEHLNASGGETTLVDGFYGAMRLKEEYPEDYKFLTTFDVETQYCDDNHYITHASPVITIDKKTEDIKQIRLKTYDRAPMAFSSSEECSTYYRSLRNLAAYYDNPSNYIKFKLKPGNILVMDNYRVLHGRSAFSGHRVLCGGTVARSNWLGRARALGLIE